MKKTITFIITILLVAMMLPVQVFAVERINEGYTPSGIPFSQMEAKIDEVVNRYLGITTPGVAVAVVKDGEIIFLGNYGYADTENNILISESSVFAYGSTAKLFTFVSVMQLVEQGLLDLDDDIRNYLSYELSGHISNLMRFDQAITMRDILNHSTGFADSFFGLSVDQTRPIPSLRDSLLNQRPRQMYEPGIVSGYSNFMSALAGYIVEYIAEQNFYAYQMENIFARTGMTNTAGNADWSDNPNVLDDRVNGYSRDTSGSFVNTAWPMLQLYPAGSAIGTAEDLARFAIALMPEQGQSGPLFKSAETLNQMLSPSYDRSGAFIGSYHGFMRYHGEQVILSHGGDYAPINSSHFIIVPEERFGLIFLTNAGSEFAIRSALFDLLISDHSSIVTPLSNLPDPNQISGLYVSARRSEGNFTELFDYLSLATIEVIGENRISMSYMGFEMIYEQVAPYVYLFREGTPHSILGHMMSRLEFEVADGLVTHVRVGNGWDLSPLPSNRTMPILTGSVAVVISSMIYFLLTTIVLLIPAIRAKKPDKPFNKQFSRYQLATAISGIALIINSAIAILRFATNMFGALAAQFQPHIVLNYALTVIAVAFIILSLVSLKNGSVSIKRKISFGVMVSMIVLLCTVLMSWNFYTIHF